MLKIGNRIQLTPREKKFLTLCVGRTCDPRTQEDLDACIAFARADMDLCLPEERLLDAILDSLKRNEFLGRVGEKAGEG
jgi:hypothetical protein